MAKLQSLLTGACAALAERGAQVQDPQPQLSAVEGAAGVVPTPQREAPRSNRRRRGRACTRSAKFRKEVHEGNDNYVKALANKPGTTQLQYTGAAIRKEASSIIVVRALFPHWRI